ncbi:type IV pilus inner membrane component PilO [Thermodesulfatator atlanticus]|uniref:type 4a pilus biogenesis protein PilO n=1 Tax=Thermodesulfatator atlanticus TaxID=501497 RepID=UPI0003B67A9F|nr:type 4a pilus biogenesis protein PilO [Thermodesulfatator atlanticus]
MKIKIQQEIEKIKNQWNGLSKRDKTIIKILAIVGPLLLYIKLIALPAKENIDKLIKEKQKIEQQINQAQIAEAQLRKIEKELKELKKISKEAEKILPSKMEIASLLQSISDESKRFNLSIIEFKTQQEQDTENLYKKIPIILKAEGSFNNIMLFIDNIRSKEKILTPKKIILSKKDKTLLADCTLITYRTLTPEEIKEKKNPKNKKRKR